MSLCLDLITRNRFFHMTKVLKLIICRLTLLLSVLAISRFNLTILFSEIYFLSTTIIRYHIKHINFCVVLIFDIQNYLFSIFSLKFHLLIPRFHFQKLQTNSCGKLKSILFFLQKIILMSISNCLFYVRELIIPPCCDRKL